MTDSRYTHLLYIAPLLKLLPEYWREDDKIIRRLVWKVVSRTVGLCSFYEKKKKIKHPKITKQAASFLLGGNPVVSLVYLLIVAFFGPDRPGFSSIRKIKKTKLTSE